MRSRWPSDWGSTGEELKAIEWGGLLHDVGKMAVPDEILRKVGPLSDREWSIMRQHPGWGFEMLADIRFLQKTALQIVYSHHERWDGEGYPTGLLGEDIPLAARIFAVVDTYDAITSDRPYRRAGTHHAAVIEPRKGGGPPARPAGGRRVPPHPRNGVAPPARALRKLPHRADLASRDARAEQARPPPRGRALSFKSAQNLESEYPGRVWPPSFILISPQDRKRLLAEGLESFRHGDFYAAHDAWEEVWRSTTAEPKDLPRGLIQIAAGLHLERDLDRPVAALRVLGPGRGHLETHGPTGLGLDLSALASKSPRSSVGSRRAAPICARPRRACRLLDPEALS